MRYRGPSVLLLISLGIAATSANGSEPLDKRIEAVLQTPGFQTAQWGLLVVDRKTGETVYERNADRMFAPASVTKLYTTAAALLEFGPDHRFLTPIFRRGDVDPNGTLQGDLILVASGDPCLGGRTGPEGELLFEDDDHTYAGSNGKGTLVKANPLAGLESLARDIASAGIKAITGDILIDDRLFDRAPSSGSGPTRVTPIVINDNLIDLVVTPADEPGKPAHVEMVPNTSFITLDADVTTREKSHATSLSVEEASGRGVVLRGSIPLGRDTPAITWHEVSQPADFARALLIEALNRHGVRVRASALGSNDRAALPSSQEVAKLPKVAEYTSPPFRENVKVILKVSHNLHASTLPLLIAARHGERSLSQGMRREGALLKTLGVDLSTISLGSGAGGSRADLVTPRATVTLLRQMTLQPSFAAYDSALPVLGRDGTLTTAVDSDSPAKGHVRAKTGTYYVENALNDHTVLTSKALAGYMETASDRPLAFAFFLNNLPSPPVQPDGSEGASAAGRVLGRLCEQFFDDRAE
jgi:D-alanyl-D-alanine carboxypeptidase/D-alanyl-D-alanine-endopeptidase (penicillin-binding protein 4)